MSYFSHHPEKWIEIERRGIVDCMKSICFTLDEDEVHEYLGELAEGNALEKTVLHMLTDNAAVEIGQQQLDFFSDQKEDLNYE